MDAPAAETVADAPPAPTGRRIAAGLMLHRYRRNFVLPGYTPAKWWECDVFELTKAGFFREYEVKVSRADFLADRAKAKREWEYRPRDDDGPGKFRRVEVPGAAKHDLLAAGDPRGPSRFWFVTPAGLLRLTDLPVWAGLIEVETHPEDRHWYREKEVRPAPRLHKQGCPEAVAKHAAGICYWRMHEALIRERSR